MNPLSPWRLKNPVGRVTIEPEEFSPRAADQRHVEMPLGNQLTAVEAGKGLRQYKFPDNVKPSPPHASDLGNAEKWVSGFHVARPYASAHG